MCISFPSKQVNGEEDKYTCNCPGNVWLFVSLGIRNILTTDLLTFRLLMLIIVFAHLDLYLHLGF